MNCVSLLNDSARSSEGAALSEASRTLLDGLVHQYGPRIKLRADKPEESPEATVRALWLRALGCAVSSVKAMQVSLADPTPEQVSRITELLELRAGGAPLAYLTGKQNFMGLELDCGTCALIPRKETELLGNAACSLLRAEILPGTSQPRVLDLCAGAGNLACSVAYHIPQCQVFASDLSAEAAQLAERNARNLQLEPRVRVFAGDLFAPFERPEFLNSFDLIMCNPPYISAARLPRMDPEIIQHEPKMAFDGGAFGVSILTRLVHDAPGFLRTAGWLAFEVGLGQGPGLVRRLQKDPRYQRVEGLLDCLQEVRGVIAQRAP